MAGDRCIVGGYARLPQTTAAAQVYQMVTIVALVDRRTDIVIEASVTLVTPVARAFGEGLLVGSNLLSAQDEFLEEIGVNYGGGAQKAIKQAFKDLCDRYLEMRSPAEPSPR